MWAASVIAGEPAERAMVADILTSVGWRTVGMDERPDLVLTADIDGDRPAVEDGDRLRSPPGMADATLVAWGSAPADRLMRRGFDDVLPRPCSPRRLRELLARWRPVDASPTLDRLAAQLGRPELQMMTERLHTQLTLALTSLADGADRAEAHRIAGIAGMLGLPDLGKAWLAVAEGRLRAPEAARIASRLALAALTRSQDEAAAASGSSTASRSAQRA